MEGKNIQRLINILHINLKILSFEKYLSINNN